LRRPEEGVQDVALVLPGVRLARCEVRGVGEHEGEPVLLARDGEDAAHGEVDELRSDGTAALAEQLGGGDEAQAGGGLVLRDDAAVGPREHLDTLPAGERHRGATSEPGTTRGTPAD